MQERRRGIPTTTKMAAADVVEQSFDSVTKTEVNKLEKKKI